MLRAEVGRTSGGSPRAKLLYTGSLLLPRLRSDFRIFRPLYLPLLHFVGLVYGRVEFDKSVQGFWKANFTCLWNRYLVYIHIKTEKVIDGVS